MNKFDFNNKRFAVIENSDNGEVNTQTLFHYQQKGNLVTVDYSGGTITYGKIIANLKDDRLHMLYQCLTVDNELKAGKALAKIKLTENGKIKLTLDWEWLDDENGKGRSEYIEIE